MTHRLEKFRIDRTWYGDRQLHQGGRARDLVKGMVPFWLTLAVIGLLGWRYYSMQDAEAALGTALLAIPVLAIAWGWYVVRSFRVLTASKTAGAIGFRSKARAPRVIGIYVFGYGLAAIVTSIAAVAAGFLVLAMMFAGEGAMFSLDDLDNLGAPGFALQVFGCAVYFLVFVIWATLRHVFVTLPIWRHYAETLEILGAQSPARVRVAAHRAESRTRRIDQDLVEGPVLLGELLQTARDRLPLFLEPCLEGVLNPGGQVALDVARLGPGPEMDPVGQRRGLLLTWWTM